jgi:glycosyltransferase involved in cell wall biosynthesis
MNDRSDLAICMPVHNSENTIARVIDQILSQTYRDFHLIITDDCSSDGTIREIERFTDPRLILLSNEKNLGAPATRNRMLDYCIEHGYEFMALMDADDDVNPDRIEKQIAILRRDPSLAVCGSSMFVEKTGRIWHAETDPARVKVLCIMGNPIPTPSAMLSLRHMQLHDLRWKPGSSPCADYQLWAEMLFTHNLRASNTGDVDMTYRHSPEGVSHRHGIDKQEMKDVEVKQYILKNFGIDCASVNLVGFMLVALCRSGRAADAESFLHVCNELLEKNQGKVVDDKILRRLIRDRTLMYLVRCKGVAGDVRVGMRRLLGSASQSWVYEMEVHLCRFKRRILDDNFPTVSRVLAWIYSRARSGLSKAKRLLAQGGGWRHR